jgi:pyruvate dehydrogenase E1 component alpha subunit
MVELRLFEEHITALQRRARASVRLHLTPGEEAVRVSTTIDLAPGDLVSDAVFGAATGFLRGEKLPELLHRVYTMGSGARKTGSQDADGASGQLPCVADAKDRLYLAMGAALALKQRSPGKSKSRSILVAYVYSGQLATSDWKQILRFAATHTLPMLFVVLRGAAGSRPGSLSLAASEYGVPGIPVDAADPVALYRVAQESSLRARAGGGPVLMECVPFVVPASKVKQVDPIESFGQSLVRRRLVTEDWLASLPKRFARRLQAAER